MGIGGAFAGRAPIGAITVGTRSIAADLGAASPDGFIPVQELGFGRNAFDTDPSVATALSQALDATMGEILTVNTVTGTEARAAELSTRHPGAVVEAMEGFGVATAADGIPFGEVRTISNLVGKRDRAAWRIGDALAALSKAAAAVGTLEI
jgi:futalosine hydrolase